MDSIWLNTEKAGMCSKNCELHSIPGGRWSSKDRRTDTACGGTHLCESHPLPGQNAADGNNRRNEDYRGTLICFTYHVGIFHNLESLYVGSELDSLAAILNLETRVLSCGSRPSPLVS